MTNKTEMEKVVEKLTKTYKALSKDEAEKCIGILNSTLLEW